jgi:hypothetical protein
VLKLLWSFIGVFVPLLVFIGYSYTDGRFDRLINYFGLYATLASLAGILTVWFKDSRKSAQEIKRIGYHI